MTSARLYIGDCLSVLPTLEAESVDSICTDPPYHLTQASRNGSPRTNDPATPFGRTRLGEKGFMGKTWDGGAVAFRPELWAAALTVAKPGARLLAFGGTRTFHRLACAIEDAGWRIEDTLCWLYGSGFPKHRSKLKPAYEPIILAHKPAKYAVPLNIDACRIAGAPSGLQPYSRAVEQRESQAANHLHVTFTDHPSGRWPANVVLDESAALSLDAASGTLTSGDRSGIQNADKFKTAYRVWKGNDQAPTFGDTGGASRFFFTAKAARSEREAGLRASPDKNLLEDIGNKWTTVDYRDGHTRRVTVKNHHPTVKPLDLMQWLVRLITPSGGVVLDPFCGSGTTGCAALSEGMRFIGIEQDPEYAEIARQRIAHWGMQIAMPLIAEGGA